MFYKAIDISEFDIPITVEEIYIFTAEGRTRRLQIGEKAIIRYGGTFNPLQRFKIAASFMSINRDKKFLTAMAFWHNVGTEIDYDVLLHTDTGDVYIFKKGITARPNPNNVLELQIEFHNHMPWPIVKTQEDVINEIKMTPEQVEEYYEKLFKDRP